VSRIASKRIAENGCGSRHKPKRSILGPRSGPNDAKCGLGPLIELPVAGAKHGRPVVVVMAVEDFELLKALESPAATPAAKRE
jgi:hypothetical protein